MNRKLMALCLIGALLFSAVSGPVELCAQTFAGAGGTVPADGIRMPSDIGVCNLSRVGDRLWEKSKQGLRPLHEDVSRKLLGIISSAPPGQAQSVLIEELHARFKHGGGAEAFFHNLDGRLKLTPDGCRELINPKLWANDSPAKTSVVTMPPQLPNSAILSGGQANTSLAALGKSPSSDDLIFDGSKSRRPPAIEDMCSALSKAAPNKAPSVYSKTDTGPSPQLHQPLRVEVEQKILSGSTGRSIALPPPHLGQAAGVDAETNGLSGIPALNPKTGAAGEGDIDGRIRKGLDFFRRTQSPDGSWAARMLTSTVMYNCEMIFLYEALNLLSEKKDIVSGLVKYIWTQQNADGSFSNYPDGPGHDDISVQAYLAAKMAGEDERSERMLKLETYIRKHSSLKHLLMAEPYLVYFRLKPAPPIPPLQFALMLDSRLPNMVGVVGYPFMYLVKSHQCHVLADSKVPRRLGLDTISQQKKRSVSGEEKIFQWLGKNMHTDGTLFDFLPTTVFALIALSTKKDNYSDLLAKGIKTLESFLVDMGDKGLYQSLGPANVGETDLVLMAAMDIGVPPDDPMIRQAGYYLWNSQNKQNGAFNFVGNSEHYPDVDTTGTTIYALKRLALLSNDAGADDKLRKGVDWLITKQNKDGGFGTYEKESLVGKVMFSLMKLLGKEGISVFSQSLPEQTARDVLALSLFRDKSEKIEKAYNRAVDFLLRRQQADGSYPGDWFVGYVSGTGWATNALTTKFSDPRVRPAVEKGIKFMLAHQRPDGGFSESPASNTEKRSVPLSQSSPAQTGFILGQLLTVRRNTGDTYRSELDPAIRRAARYLTATQQNDGLWHDKTWTAQLLDTEYLIYPYVQEMIPLYALGAYHQFIKNITLSAIEYAEGFFDNSQDAAPAAQK